MCECCDFEDGRYQCIVCWDEERSRIARLEKLLKQALNNFPELTELCGARADVPHEQELYFSGSRVKE